MKSNGMKLLALILAGVCCLVYLEAGNAAEQPKLVDVFTGGQNGYHTYRIPAVITTPKGTLLAFCEGRKLEITDQSPTDMVLKRSLDGGRTWKAMQIILKGVPAAFMDPCPVVDRSTGRVFLLVDRWPAGGVKQKRVAGIGMDSITSWMTSSTDEGVSWSEPVNLTAMVKKPEWAGIVHGPGVGIQARDGRLIIPCSRYVDGLQAYVIYSEDGGKSWQRGGRTGPQMSESQVVELADGSLMMNMRSKRGKKCRAVAFSRDGGKTWTDPADVPELIEPVCQASILRYTLATDHGRNRLLFSNPASQESRINGTVRLSYDEGKTWPVGRTIYAGSFHYSCLTVLPEMTIGCLFERDGCGKISFTRFGLGWLTEGQDKLESK